MFLMATEQTMYWLSLREAVESTWKNELADPQLTAVKNNLLRLFFKKLENI